MLTLGRAESIRSVLSRRRESMWASRATTACRTARSEAQRLRRVDLGSRSGGLQVALNVWQLIDDGGASVASVSLDHDLVERAGRCVYMASSKKGRGRPTARGAVFAASWAMKALISLRMTGDPNVGTIDIFFGSAQWRVVKSEPRSNGSTSMTTC